MQKPRRTICVVKNHVVVQLCSAGRGQFEDLKGASSSDDRICRGDRRNDVLNHPLGQTIRDSQNTYKRMTRPIRDMLLSSFLPWFSFSLTDYKIRNIVWYENRGPKKKKRKKKRKKKKKKTCRALQPFAKLSRRSTKCDLDRRHRWRRPHRKDSPWATVEDGHIRCNALAAGVYVRSYTKESWSACK